jgi:hypothetical protein
VGENIELLCTCNSPSDFRRILFSINNHNDNIYIYTKQKLSDILKRKLYDRKNVNRMVTDGMSAEEKV